MLLGCCHCDRVIDPPSESSESMSFEDPISVHEPTCADGLCIGGVIAKRYNVLYSFGSGAMCGGFYNGVFPVTNLGSGSSPCSMSSSPYGINIKYGHGGACNDDPGNRFTVVFNNTPDGSGPRVLAVVITKSTRPSWPTAGIAYVLYSTSINCLAPITLTRLGFYTTAMLDQFAYNITDGLADGSAVPSSLTLEPF
jgi:hypothetical protein